MIEQFKINIYSDDANFCSSLAIECNKYGFDLTFIEPGDINDKELLESAEVSVIIIDLTFKDGDPYKIGEKARIKCNLPIFGVLDKLNRKNQKKASKSGFDLVFTKSMLLKSIKEIVVHIANDE